MKQGEYYQNREDLSDIIQIWEYEEGDKTFEVQEYVMSVLPVEFKKVPWISTMNEKKMSQYRHVLSEEVMVLRDSIQKMMGVSFCEWVDYEDEDDDDDAVYVLTEKGKELVRDMGWDDE